MTPKIISYAMSALFIAQTLAVPAQAENLTKANVARTVDSANTATATLRRDVYRTESYKDNYTVEVPYQDTETYYEDVPYQDYESYTDYEDYWDTDRVCRTVTEYQESCHDVRKCEPTFENRCERKRVCGAALPAATNLLIALLHSETTFAAKGDDERRERENRDRENREREGRERENRERESRERENRERGERERRERETRDRENRDRENRDRENRERETRERGERERREKETRERETRDRENRERENRDRENRERGERERGERERREREERDRRDRDNRDREDRDRRDREERDRRDRERCHREVCERVKTGETCRNERECRRRPVQVEKCENQQVRKTRPVTKQRWVTKYRQESRTRTVTRYRTETRCCVTRERQVFDHAYTANVELRFPQEAALVGTETEKFAVELVGYDDTASIKVTPVSAIYKYEPEITQTDVGTFVVLMHLVPTYEPADLGEATLDKFQLSALGNITQLTFIDQGTVVKVQTDYQLIVSDLQGQEITRATYNPQGQAQVRWQLPVNIAAGTKVKAQLRVLRTGVVLSGPVDFNVTKELQIQDEAKYDIAPYADKNQVGKFSMEGRTKNLTIFFRDLTKDIPQVKSQYIFKVSLMEKGVPRVLAEKTFLRELLKVAVDGRIPLSAAVDFGIAEADLALLTGGKTLLIEGSVVRNGTRFPNGSVAIPKKVSLTIE